VVLLSIVMPGAGQIFNRHFIKAIIFLAIEHIVNTLANINRAIYLDFNGFHQEALKALDYQFALFYPGIFLVSIWDAFYHAKPDCNRNAVVFFIVSGAAGTICILFASYLQFPTFTIGMSLIVPIVVGAVIYRN
jgi:hypothetical protein